MGEDVLEGEGGVLELPEGLATGDGHVPGETGEGLEEGGGNLGYMITNCRLISHSSHLISVAHRDCGKSFLEAPSGGP